MSAGDIVYLAFKTSEPILIGNKYTVFRASEEIRHPVTGKRAGGSITSWETFKSSINMAISLRQKSLNPLMPLEKGDYDPTLFERKDGGPRREII